MSGLPPGWEWDYDGARWFYRYKPNGHIQFHFPKEGDEFPDFIDALSPVPELAPEEKLESQQQLKRRAPTTDGDRKSQMRATGGPLADFGMNRSGFGGPGAGKDDEDGDGFFYQPENFMYLGPGAYSDVSPVADEDGDEIPKDRHKNEASGAQGDAKDKTMLDATSDDKTGVSPLQSETNTPSVVNSVLARDVPTVPEPVAEEPRPEPVLIVSTHDLPQPRQPAADSPGVPLLDSVEKPRQEPPPVVYRPPWDPVGIMAEMATEETAAAHIEIHPDPVEMADSSVLAPIETRMIDLGIAELPERTSPSDARPLVPSTHDLLHRTTMTDADLHGATFGSGSGSRPQSSSPTNSIQVKPETEIKAVAPKPDVGQSFPQIEAQQPQASTPPPNNNTAFAIKRKPSNPLPKQGKYQPYKPGAVPTVATEKQNRDPEFKQREHRNSLAREASLMMGNRQKFETIPRWALGLAFNGSKRHPSSPFRVLALLFMKPKFKSTQLFNPCPNLTRALQCKAETRVLRTPAKHEVNMRTSLDSDLAVAPLFSKAQTKATVTAVSVNKAPPGTGDKWAKKPAVDYSGDDWGDDPWDYQ
ncbi:hypothetical protein CPLU01_03299 [Colletotrichum plurivorum]|uniref:WW domain-containing protein n=1 Tax=Colletotrichum plurivorum TaxID=2175906 RepID=A0A8H6KT32_9PEZI|nr:hypothetical protein CPLU01_03299 [Colletotrichum plurivorum]